MISGITGAFQAWVTHIFGDSTAREQGMTSINPFVHVDPTSLILLPVGYVFFNVVIGLSRPVPIDWRAIRAPWRKLKLVGVVFAQPFAILMLLFGLMVLRTGLILCCAQSIGIVQTILHVYSYVFGAAVGFCVWFIPYQILMSLTQIYVYERELSAHPVNQMLILTLVPLLGSVLLMDVSRIVLTKMLSFMEAGIVFLVHFII